MGRQSDSARILAWWKTLARDGFVALAPPTRNRYTQSDGHGDFAEIAHAQGLAPGTSFAFWHWQSHQRAFPKRGHFVGPLYIYWSGDHDVVRQALGDGPDGFQVIDNGVQGAFQVEKVTVTDEHGLPDPSDEVGVRQVLDRLNEPYSRRSTPFAYPPLTGPEETWLHARLAGHGELAELLGFVRPLELRDAVTPQEADLLGARWLAEYGGRLDRLSGYWSLLRALVRVDDEKGWLAVAEIGGRAYDAVASVGSARAVHVLGAAAVGGAADAAGEWLNARLVQAGIRDGEGDPTQIAADIAAELDRHDPADEVWQKLLGELEYRLVTFHWGNGPFPDEPVDMIAVHNSLDERFPAAARTRFAFRARPNVERLMAWAATRPDDEVLWAGYSVAQARADLARFADEMAAPAAATGPVLTGSESVLTAHWDAYRQLSAADVTWLRERIADPATEMQGVGFCLELLYAHGVGTAAEVDALAPRWRKVLAKSYKTTYTEWRHPMVTLTCLAREIEHPLAETLMAWWAKTPPIWKGPLALMTGLGEPSEAAAGALIDYIRAGEHDTGQLRTWALIRSRLDSVAPALAIDELINDRRSGVRPYQLRRELIAVADPLQPLWHYDIGSDLRWWDRIVETVDNPALSRKGRALALEAAADHRLLSYPEYIRPKPDDATVAAAKRWYQDRA